MTAILNQKTHIWDNKEPKHAYAFMTQKMQNANIRCAVLLELKCFPNKGSWVAVLGEFLDYRLFFIV